jgi:hypothetical protein
LACNEALSIDLITFSLQPNHLVLNSGFYGEVPAGHIESRWREMESAGKALACVLWLNSWEYRIGRGDFEGLNPLEKERIFLTQGANVVPYIRKII